MLDYPIMVLLDNLFFNPENRLTLFNVFIPSTVAAFAIYKVRKWSFPVVLVIILWLSGNMLKEFSTLYGFWTILVAIIIPILINIALVSYILIPNVYIFYRDSLLRWWERDKRFVHVAPVEILLDGKELHGKILNVSMGGCFLESLEEIPEDSVFSIRLTLLTTLLSLKDKIGHRRKSEMWGYGVKFIDISKGDKNDLRNVMKQLEKANTPVVNPAPEWREDLKIWLQELFKTGRGITPESPGNDEIKK
jgi:hypothetical protein